MAKTDNLTDYLIDLADGIRAKKGTTEPINPQDFRKEIESISGGGEFSPEYYLFDGAKAYNAIASMLGITGSLQINAKCREIYINYIGALGLAMAKYIYKGRLYTDYYLGENKTSISNDNFVITNVSAVMQIDGEIALRDAYAALGLPSDILTPCTKEEFEALIID